MNLIFHNGEKLFMKEQSLSSNYTDYLKHSCGIKLNSYQKDFLNCFIKQNKSEYNIFGDDFKIEFTPRNLNGHCVLAIKDFDENQKFESEIVIGFNKTELSQLISLLETLRDGL